MLRDVCVCALVCILTVCLAVQGQSTGPIVRTIYGDLRGVSETDSINRPYDAFYGVPFAVPPLGELRFRAAQTPPESWDGIRNATEFGPHCVQLLGGTYRFLGMGSVDSEDCLYLNIYVPVNVEYAQSQNLPVMFFFYGGAYLIGTSEMYPGQELATQGNVIVVSTNYRVSFLGFLSTGDEHAPGNYALWDGKAALEWTVANIAAFGGDPQAITVFGHSAGAGMTMFSSLSPQTNSLFQRAIAVSGSATGLTTTVDNPKSTTQHLADLFFCNTTDSAEIVACLREKDAKDLDTLGLISISDNENRVPDTLPVIDQDFIIKDPRQSFEDGDNAHIDVMTGYTVHDAAAFALGNAVGAPPLFNRTIDANLNNTEIYDFFIRSFGGYDDPEGLYQVLLDRYPEINDTDDVVCSKAATQVTTYWFFSAAAHWEAEKHNAQAQGSTYLYQFEYRPTFLTGYPEWINGSHMDDLYSVLGDPFMKVFRIMFLDHYEFLEDDLRMKDNVQARFVNFAYTGNPNEGPFTDLAPWPEYDTSRQFLIQSTIERITTLDADALDDIEWFLYEFWPLLKPQWGNNKQESAETDLIQLETEEESIPIDEDDFAEALARTRQMLYDRVGRDPDMMSQIDDRIDSALLSRETYRLMSIIGL